MSYHQGYPQGPYAGYQGYGQPPQTYMYQAHLGQYQQQQHHPMVVIPAQPRREVANFQTSPPLQQAPYQSNFYQQPPQPQPQAQYQQSGQEQYFASQRQKYQAQAALPQQYSNQGLHQGPPRQAVYQPPQSYPAQQSSPQLQYQQQPSPQLQYQQHPSPQLPYQQHQQQSSPQLQYQRQPKPQGQSASPQFPSQQLPSYSGSPPLPQASQPYVHPQVLINSSRPRPDEQTPRTQQQQQRPQLRAQIPSSPDPLQSSTPQRRVAHVEIPIQRSSQVSMKSEMAPAPKRRRSNQGQAVPVCGPSASQMKRAVSNQHIQAPPSSSPLTQLNSSQMPSTPTPMLKNEYQPMLLALADEYINAAYGISSQVDSDDQREEYHCLMSMGMACLESILSSYRQSDVRREARIRLRLAGLMVDETDNDEQAEDVLSKGVSLCDRNRLIDLKYSMRHTSVRLTATKNLKAALKATDNLIQEVETLKLYHWVYTFRFLRISLSLQSGTNADLTTVLKHLNAVNALADEQRNASVQIVAASIEAVVHLRIGSSEAGDLAQRSLAAARTHQLGPEMQALPQIRGLVDCLDLTCALSQLNSTQASAKMQQMHANLDKGTRDAGWTKDGSFTIPIGPVDNDELEQDAKGIMKLKDGQACLVMKWITSSQLYGLGFLLSGLTGLLLPNSGDTKMEKYLGDGVKMTKVTPSVRQSLAATEANAEQRETLNIVMRLYAMFARCGQGDWQSARAAVQELRKDFASVGAVVDQRTQRMLIYLEGMCKQGLGELKAAVQLYESPLLTSQLDIKASVAEKDLRVLATMNRILILRSLGTAEAQACESLLAEVEPYCRSHSNESMLAAFQILKAMAEGSSGSIIRTKQYLQSAIQASKRVNNKQLIYVLMNLMTESFFHSSIIGDQAERAAHAGVQLAKTGRSRLWTVVADSMYSDIMERCGKLHEAEKAREEAMKFYPGLPTSLKESLDE